MLPTNDGITTTTTTTTTTRKKRTRLVPKDDGNETGKAKPPTTTKTAVEPPIHTTPASRAGQTHLLKLAIRVTTLYRSFAGARRQSVVAIRRSLPADGSRIGHNWSVPNESTGIAAGDAPLPDETPIPPPIATTAAARNKSAAMKPSTTAEGTPRVSRLQWMMLPELLSEDVWNRHGYSLADIRRTLDVFPARVIWQLVLSYNRAATNASSRVCSDAEPRLTAGGRSTAVQKLLAVLKETNAGLETRASVTWNNRNDGDDDGDDVPVPVERHQPGLPVHRLEHTVFDDIARYVADGHNNPKTVADPMPFAESSPSKPSVMDDDAAADDPSSFDAVAPPRLARGIFSWRGILVAPLELSSNGDLLLMSRVVPWNVYTAAHGVPAKLLSVPNAILAPEGFYALLDECFFFFAGRRDDDIRRGQQIRAGLSTLPLGQDPAIPVPVGAVRTTGTTEPTVSAVPTLWTGDTVPARKRVRIE